jgi:hypothetical protein
MTGLQDMQDSFRESYLENPEILYINYHVASEC